MNPGPGQPLCDPLCVQEQELCKNLVAIPAWVHSVVADPPMPLVHEIADEHEALLEAELLQEPVHFFVPIIQRLDLSTLTTLTLQRREPVLPPRKDGRKGDLHRRIAFQDLSGQPTVLVNVRAGTNAGVVCANVQNDSIKIGQGVRHLGKQGLDSNATKRPHFDSHPVIRWEILGQVFHHRIPGHQNSRHVRSATVVTQKGPNSP